MKSKLLDAFNFSSLSRWMIPPAKGWHSKSHDSLVKSGLYWPFYGLLSCLLLGILTTFFYWYLPEISNYLIVIIAVLITTSLFLLVNLLNIVQKNLITPLAHIRHWANRMRGGNLIAKIPTPIVKNEFYLLTEDINQLSDTLKNLTQDMKEQVRIQNMRNAQKSKSLAILYEVATSINQSKDLDSLLSHFLYILKKLTHAEAASVRILTSSNELRLIAHTGLSEATIKSENNMSIETCMCGQAVKEGSIKIQPIKTCEKIIQTPLLDSENLNTIAVPLMYRNKCLGVYNFYVAQDFMDELEELTGLLTSIGQNLGIAIEKQNLETQAKRVALMEERTFLSHELHDSLAQTLVSLKFQTQLLDDSFKNNQYQTFENELNNLDSGLNKANEDLRDLLDHFRIGMDERGLIPALTELSTSIQTDSGINCYFQDESNKVPLPPNYEVQVLHIVQEALSNARKHSQAKNVRILIREQNKTWKVIVEDDGIGIQKIQSKSKPGENIGLSIMQERAKHINGVLQIESEVDEGTRIELSFKTVEQKIKEEVIDLTNL